MEEEWMHLEDINSIHKTEEISEKGAQMNNNWYTPAMLGEWEYDGETLIDHRDWRRTIDTFARHSWTPRNVWKQIEQPQTSKITAMGTRCFRQDGEQ